MRILRVVFFGSETSLTLPPPSIAGELYVSALCKEDRKQNSALEEAVLDLLEDKFKGEETNLPKIMNIAVNKGENST